MTSLNQMKCVPCTGAEPALSSSEIERYLRETPQWQVITEEGQPKLKRVFKFKDFNAALAFTNQVGQAAEEQDHHPALLTEWGKVTVWWWTHAIHGLHSNDFIMASRADQIYSAEHG